MEEEEERDYRAKEAEKRKKKKKREKGEGDIAGGSREGWRHTFLAVGRTGGIGFSGAIAIKKKDPRVEILSDKSREGFAARGPRSRREIDLIS